MKKVSMAISLRNNFRSSSVFAQKKRVIIAILLLLLVSFFWNFWMIPKYTSFPDDFRLSAQLVSIDNFYDQENQNYSGGVFSKTKYSYETIQSNKETSIIKNVFEVFTPDDKPVFSVERTYGINKKTRQHVSGIGDKDRSGYLFAPRDLSKGESYTYWHTNYDGPALMEYVGQETLYGLGVYKYQASYENVEIDQTQNLTYLPEVGRTKGIILEPTLQLWVEPTTGRLIKYSDDTIAYYYDLRTKERLTPWNHFTNTFSEQSVKEIVKEVGLVKSKIKIIGFYVPLLLRVILF